MKKHSYVSFDWDNGSPEDGQEWLQITAITGIGGADQEIRQKIIRLNEDRQKQLYDLLAAKFSQPKKLRTVTD